MSKSFCVFFFSVKIITVILSVVTDGERGSREIVTEERKKHAHKRLSS